MKGEVCLREHLFEHFNSERHNGFLHDVSVILVDKTDEKNPIKRVQPTQRRRKDDVKTS